MYCNAKPGKTDREHASMDGSAKRKAVHRVYHPVHMTSARKPGGYLCPMGHSLDDNQFDSGPRKLVTKSFKLYCSLYNEANL